MGRKTGKLTKSADVTDRDALPLRYTLRRDSDDIGERLDAARHRNRQPDGFWSHAIMKDILSNRAQAILSMTGDVLSPNPKA